MFCVHCGGDGAGRFCPTCGQRQPLSGAAQPNPNRAAEDISPENVTEEVTEEVIEAVIADEEPWAESIHYQRVLDHPESRRRIAAAGRGASPGVTGEDLLAVFDAVSPIGFSLGKFTQAILPIYDKLGIKTSQQAQATFDAPPGRVLSAILCTLAGRSLEIREVRQGSDRCSLHAQIPAGLVTNRGHLSILVERQGGGVHVSLTIHISGQWYDWGKSTRLMDALLADIRTDLASQLAGLSLGDRRVA